MNIAMQTIQGSTRLAFDSVESVTNAVERMHETIARAPLPWSPPTAEMTRAHGFIAAGVYAVIRGINATLREGVDRSFTLLPDQNNSHVQSRREGLAIAALNGVLGDYLEASGNPLATPMQLLTPQRKLPLDPESLLAELPVASPHLVVMVHGLSLSELGWQRKGNPSLGERLNNALDLTSLYLRYNTGRHISTNGQDFCLLLDQLCRSWPVPVQSVSLVGHSMGGLVIRSACWHAAQAGNEWLPRLSRVVCLGTPHHGSHVERIGRALDLAMQKSPYTEPLAFGRHRSAGIKDLRYGDLLDEDWQGHHPDQPRPDTRRSVPLLPGVDYYFAAATLGRHGHDPLGQLLGDLLVRLDSATGSHEDRLKSLAIKPENCAIFHEKNHFDLLHDPRVHQQIIEWFRAE
jgi:pimeloyl-ACP methyl ester carboxylesterase